MSVKDKVLNILKDEGLDLAEDAAEKVVKAGFKIGKLLISESENKVDDLLLPLFDLVEPRVLELVDKIDGEKG